MHKPDPAPLLALAGAIPRGPAAPLHEVGARGAAAARTHNFSDSIAPARRGGNAFVARRDHPGRIHADGGVTAIRRHPVRARIETGANCVSPFFTRARD